MNNRIWHLEIKYKIINWKKEIWDYGSKKGFGEMVKTNNKWGN